MEYGDDFDLNALGSNLIFIYQFFKIKKAVMSFHFTILI